MVINIIFLDIDGVLNNSLHLAHSKHHSGLEFDPSCVANLVEVLDETDSKLVISSTWRKGETVDTLNSTVLDYYGLSSYVVGHTPILRERQRGAEIALFLKETDLPIDNFIIIDDDKDMGSYIHRLVRTNPRLGLDLVKRYEAVNKLNDKWHSTSWEE